MRRTASLVAALVLGAVASSVAQIPDLPTLGAGWTDVGYPKVYWTPRDGFAFGFYYAQVAPFGFADWDAPPPYRASLSLDAHITTSGSKGLTLDARMPQLVRGWRLALTLQAVRRARENYFGVGNGSVYVGDSVTDARPHFYQSDNRRYLVRAEAQRRIVGGLRVLTGLHVENWRVAPIVGGGQLVYDALAGNVSRVSDPTTEVSGRVGLVYDTRDNESEPRRGVLLEAIYGVADSAIAGELSYGRATGSAAGYLGIGEKLVLAARLTGERMSGSPGLGTYYTIEASDRPFMGLGGPDSHRALLHRRLLDADKLLANLDVRYQVLGFPTLVSVNVIGFLDAGRVFAPGEFALTTEGLSVGGGGGLMIRLFRAAVFGTTAGYGPDGAVWYFHTSWTF